MEGPSLVILREELEPFRGRKVLHVAGNTKQPKETLRNRTLSSIQTWGKQLFLGFSSSRAQIRIARVRASCPGCRLSTAFRRFANEASSARRMTSRRD